MRHGAVAYFDRDGRPVAPDDVPLTAEGRGQAAAAAALLDGTGLDRVVSSDLPRAVETAALVAPGCEVEAWPELREIAGDRFSAIPPAELEREFVGALHGIVPNDKRFLGGETIGELFDRVISSGLPRTAETAALVAPGREVAVWPELREITGDRLSSIPADELEEAFVHALHGIVPNEKRFLGGETIGELFDRVLPAVDRLLADPAWDTALVVAHGAVNRAILSHALLGERIFLGRFEQAPGCINVLDVGRDRPLEWIVRAVNVAPADPAHTATRMTQMEQYWAEYVPRRAPDTPSDPTPDGP